MDTASLPRNILLILSIALLALAMSCTPTAPEPVPVCEVWSGTQIIFLPCRTVWDTQGLTF